MLITSHRSRVLGRRSIRFGAVALGVASAVVAMSPATDAAAGAASASHSVTTARRAPHLAPVSKLRVEDFGSMYAAHWTNPRSAAFAGVTMRLTRGRHAAATPREGRPVGVATHRARTTTLTHLHRDTEYTLAIWAHDRHGRLSSSVHETFTTDARPASPGRYVGIVRDTSGHALRGADVLALVESPSGELFRQTRSDAAGRFAIRIPAGSLLVLVDGPNARGGTADATGYQSALSTGAVRAGRSTAHLFRLAPGGAVVGRVVDAQNRPLGGVGVGALPVTPYVDGDTLFDFAFDDVGNSPTTAADGTYTVRGLGSIALRVCADPAAGPLTTAGAPASTGYAGSCTSRSLVPGARRRATAPTLVLTATTRPTGSVTGSVVSARGVALRNAVVALTSGRNGYAVVATDRSGHFRADGLTPGAYKLCVEDTEMVRPAVPTGYAPRCAGNSVRVRSSAVTTSPALHLTPGAAITGTVYGPRGARMSGVEVSAGPDADDAESITRTDARGHYRLLGMRASRERVCFAPDPDARGGGPTGAVTSCYKNRAVVMARSGVERTGIDAHLSAGSALVGVVHDRAGHGVGGAEVAAVSTGDDDDDLFFPVARTTAAGRYRITGLRAGTYAICASAGSESPVFSGRGTLSCRDHVALRPHVLRTGIDLAVTAPGVAQVGVHDSRGRALAGVDVTVLAGCPKDQDDFCGRLPGSPGHRVVVVDSTVSGGRGTVDFRGLAPGNYTVCAFGYYAARAGGDLPFGYADRCSAPGAVQVRSSRTATLNLALADAGGVRGTVTDTAGHPVAGARLRVSGSAAENARTVSGEDYFDDSDDFDDPRGSNGIGEDPAADQVTASDGSFTVRAVAPGHRLLCVDTSRAAGASRSGYVATCPSGALTRGAAVTVHAGSGVRADVHVAAAGGIAGRITDRGLPAQTLVVLFDPAGDAASVVKTDAGRYAFTGLRAGRYHVCALDRSYESGTCWRAAAWDGDERPPRTATPVAVVAGATTTGIDVRLTRGRRTK